MTEALVRHRMSCPTQGPLPLSSHRPLTCSKESGEKGNRQQDRTSGHTAWRGSLNALDAPVCCTWPNTQNTPLLSSVALEARRALLRTCRAFCHSGPAHRLPGRPGCNVCGCGAKGRVRGGGGQTAHAAKKPSLGTQGHPGWTLNPPPRAHADHTLTELR